MSGQIDITDIEIIFLIEIILIFISKCIYGLFTSAFRRESRLSPPITAHRRTRPKKAGQSCSSDSGIERTAQKRLGSATRLASIGYLPSGFGPDSAGTLLDRRAGRIAACLYDPEFRHQRNLSHRDPWQQHRWKLRDSGFHRNRGAPLQYFNWDLDAVSSGDSKRRQLPGSDRILALWPRLWLSIRHSEGRWQLPDSILFTL